MNMNEKLVEFYKTFFHKDYELVGKIIFDALQHEDNSFREVGKSLVSVFLDCNSLEDFNAKNSVLIALTGKSLEDLFGDS